MNKRVRMGNELIQSEFLLYSSAEGKIKVDVFLQNESVWLTQKAMGELFGVDRSVITKHIGNIFEEGELDEKSNVQKMHFANSDKPVKMYNLDAIISVGYRVNSARATQFRIWATSVLKEYVIKGFAIDDVRLKQGSQAFGKDYFRELLETVRSIRASERRIYQQITDIFAECSIDYDKNSEATRNFYAMVQNKFHYAITGQTAPEIIHSKADSKLPHMGLQTWKNSPDGRVLASDASIGKNYLPEKDIKKLERTISGFFDYIENIIENRVKMTMADMAASVDKFLTFNEYKILHGKGKITKAAADKKAKTEYDKFNKTQKIESDFDKLTKSLQKKSQGKPRTTDK